MRVPKQDWNIIILRIFIDCESYFVKAIEQVIEHSFRVYIASSKYSERGGRGAGRIPSSCLDEAIILVNTEKVLCCLIQVHVLTICTKEIKAS